MSVVKRRWRRWRRHRRGDFGTLAYCCERCDRRDPKWSICDEQKPDIIEQVHAARSYIDSAAVRPNDEQLELDAAER